MRFPSTFARPAGVATLCVAVGCAPAAEPPGEGPQPKSYLDESEAEKDARMAWWRDARFGMFIHWGLYAIPAGEWEGRRSDRIGEWIQSWANIPRDEYARLAERFDPVKYDAAEWVALAKSAGMKYIVITSKHHEGFSLFDTAASDYDVVDATPYGRDLLAPLAEACREQGVRLGFYYSILDWHHPAQYVDPDAETPHDGHARNRIHPEQKAEYVAHMKQQLRELVTRYDPAVLWFDGEWVEWWTEPDGKDLYEYVRGLKPEVIINNRVGKGRRGMQGMNKGPGYAGDFGTPEQEIPPTGLPGVDWESCMTMNDTWGFKHYDDNWKSTETLVRNLIDIASKGGNYLLNVGPTAEGEIPEPSVERLRGIGAWMDVNGESIYGTSASPFEVPEWGRVTQKPGRLYLHVFDWPADGALRLPAPVGDVKRAYLLAQPESEPLSVSGNGASLTVRVPPDAPDPIASVIVLDL